MNADMIMQVIFQLEVTSFSMNGLGNKRFLPNLMVKAFQQENYLANRIQALFDSLPAKDYKEGCLCWGVMANFNKEAVQGQNNVNSCCFYGHSQEKFYLEHKIPKS